MAEETATKLFPILIPDVLEVKQMMNLLTLTVDGPVNQIKLSDDITLDGLFSSRELKPGHLFLCANQEWTIALEDGVIGPLPAGFYSIQALKKADGDPS